MHEMEESLFGISDSTDNVSDIRDDTSTDNCDQAEDPRLTTEEIAAFAWEASRNLYNLVARGGLHYHWAFLAPERKEYFVKLVQQIVMEASATNDHAVMARHWDAELGKKLEMYQSYDREMNPELLPWICLPEVVRMREVFFRRCVLAMLPAWKGH